MSKQEIEKLQDKIIEAVKLSSRKMFQKKLETNEMMAISHNGKVLVATASEIAKLSSSK